MLVQNSGNTGNVDENALDSINNKRCYILVGLNYVGSQAENLGTN